MTVAGLFAGALSLMLLLLTQDDDDDDDGGGGGFGVAGAFLLDIPATKLDKRLRLDRSSVVGIVTGVTGAELLLGVVFF